MSCNLLWSETVVINVPKCATLFCLFFICMGGASEWLVETNQLACSVSTCLLSVVTILSSVNNSLQIIFCQTVQKWMWWNSAVYLWTSVINIYEHVLHHWMLCMDGGYWPYKRNPVLALSLILVAMLFGHLLWEYTLLHLCTSILLHGSSV